MKFAELQQLKANGWKIVEPKVRAGLCCCHLSPVTSPSLLLPEHICAQIASASDCFQQTLEKQSWKKTRLKKGLFPRCGLVAGSLGVSGSAACKRPGRVSAGAGAACHRHLHVCADGQGDTQPCLVTWYSAGGVQRCLAGALAWACTSHVPAGHAKPTGTHVPRRSCPEAPIVCAGGEEGASPDTKEAATLQGAPGEGALPGLSGPAAAGGPQAAPGSQASCLLPPELGHRERGQHRDLHPRGTDPAVTAASAFLPGLDGAAIAHCDGGPRGHPGAALGPTHSFSLFYPRPFSDPTAGEHKPGSAPSPCPTPACPCQPLPGSGALPPSALPGAVSQLSVPFPPAALLHPPLACIPAEREVTLGPRPRRAGGEGAAGRPPRLSVLSAIPQRAAGTGPPQPLLGQSPPSPTPRPCRHEARGQGAPARCPLVPPAWVPWGTQGSFPYIHI